MLSIFFALIFSSKLNTDEREFKEHEPVYEYFNEDDLNSALLDMKVGRIPYILTSFVFDRPLPETTESLAFLSTLNNLQENEQSVQKADLCEKVTTQPEVLPIDHSIDLEQTTPLDSPNSNVSFSKRKNQDLNQDGPVKIRVTESQAFSLRAKRQETVAIANTRDLTSRTQNLIETETSLNKKQKISARISSHSYQKRISARERELLDLVKNSQSMTINRTKAEKSEGFLNKKEVITFLYGLKKELAVQSQQIGSTYKNMCKMCLEKVQNFQKLSKDEFLLQNKQFECKMYILNCDRVVKPFFYDLLTSSAHICDILHQNIPACLFYNLFFVQFTKNQSKKNIIRRSGKDAYFKIENIGKKFVPNESGSVQERDLTLDVNLSNFKRKRTKPSDEEFDNREESTIKQSKLEKDPPQNPEDQRQVVNHDLDEVQSQSTSKDKLKKSPQRSQKNSRARSKCLKWQEKKSSSQKNIYDSKTMDELNRFIISMILTCNRNPELKKYLFSNLTDFQRLFSTLKGFSTWATKTTQGINYSPIINMAFLTSKVFFNLNKKDIEGEYKFIKNMKTFALIYDSNPSNNYFQRMKLDDRNFRLVLFEAKAKEKQLQTIFKLNRTDNVSFMSNYSNHSFQRGLKIPSNKDFIKNFDLVFAVYELEE